MIKENLNDLNKEIIQIFEQHKIQESDMLNVYKNCLKDFERAYVTKMEIEENVLNSLRDIVWYNLEHKNEHDLTKLGNKFPTFMTFCDKDNIISLDEAQNLIGELNEIHRNFNEKPMYFCYMTGPLENFEDNTSINVLTTTYHLIDEKYLADNKAINILLNDYKTRIIDLEKKRNIYTNKEYDLTLIEIIKKDNINNFFDIDENILTNENHKLLYENKPIYIIHYLNMEKASFSYGICSELNESEIKHNCIIKQGSYGSPILNFANNKIIGITKEQNRNYNLGTFLKIPITEFKKQIDYNKSLEEEKKKNKLKKIKPEDTNILLEKPKMMIVFKTIKVSFPMAVDFGTTIEELLKNFLKIIKGKNKIDLKKEKIGFLFNSVRLNKNEKILKIVVEKYFNNRRLPTIIVTHL